MTTVPWAPGLGRLARGWGLPAARRATAWLGASVRRADGERGLCKRTAPARLGLRASIPRFGAGREEEKQREVFDEEELSGGKRHRACWGGQIARLLRSSVRETPQVPSACAAKGIPARFGAHTGTLATQPDAERS